MTNANADTRNGFTLMEMVVVCVMLSVIAGFAFPRYFNTVERLRAEDGKQVLMTVYGAQKRYFVDNGGNYASNIADLDVETRANAHFNDPTANDVSPLASIGRKDGTYILSISDTAQISCSGSRCAALGY